MDPHHAEGALAAHAEQDLLLDAHLLIAAVETGRQLPVLGRVGVVAGVEQEQVAASHAHAPEAHKDVAAGQLDAQTRLFALLPGHRLRGQLGRGDRLVEILLPAAPVEPLVDVALVVEEADADDRRSQVAHALQMVAGEDAQAARVDGQRLVKAELGGEVGNRPGEDRPGVDETPAFTAGKIAPQPPVRLVDAGLYLQVLNPLIDLFRGNPTQQRHRVVVDGAPDLRLQLAEDGADVGLPGPPQILGELAELLESAVDRFGHGAMEAVTGSGADYIRSAKSRPPGVRRGRRLL